MWLVWELTEFLFYSGLAAALVRVPDLLSIFIGSLVDLCLSEVRDGFFRHSDFRNLHR
jgi:hypothetical protein